MNDIDGLRMVQAIDALTTAVKTAATEICEVLETIDETLSSFNENDDNKNLINEIKRAVSESVDSELKRRLHNLLPW